MSRRLLVICAALFLVAMAVPAFAAVQNVKVSGDIIATGVSRNNFDLGRSTNNAGNYGDDDSSLFMSQVRLRVDADLTDNVMATIRLINERDWDQESDNVSGDTDNSTEVDIDLAYVTLKEMLYSPLTVVIGRQPLRYGNAMIIGDPDTSRQDTSANPIFNRDLTIRRGFDAIKAILNYDPLTIDIFFSEIDENDKQSTGQVTQEKDDVFLWGVNGAYKVGDKYNSTVQAYFFQKRDQTREAQNNDDAEVINVPGFLITTTPFKGLNLSLEQAWQSGNKYLSAGKNDHRQAMATQIIASYALQCEKLMKYSPVVGGSFTRYSGDKNPTDLIQKKTYKSWDSMYIDQGVGTIANVLFDKTNTKIINANVSAKPIEDVTVKLDWTSLWLDQKYNGYTFPLYQLNGTSFNSTMVYDKTHLGQEIDALITYDYTEDVQFSLLAGWYIPGDAFEDVLYNKNATEVIGACKVTF